MILITGTPRSGTHTISRLLRDAGVDTPHEQIGRDGTVSCYYCVPWTYMPHSSPKQPHENERRRKIEEFDHVYYMIRNPAKCVASMVRVVNRPHQQWAQNHGLIHEMGTSKLHRMMQMWLSTYRCVQDPKFTTFIRTEHIKKDWPFNLPVPKEVPVRARATGYYKPDPLTKRDLDKCDKKLSNSMYELYKELTCNL